MPAARTAGARGLRPLPAHRPARRTSAASIGRRSGPAGLATEFLSRSESSRRRPGSPSSPSWRLQLSSTRGALTSLPRGTDELGVDIAATRLDHRVSGQSPQVELLSQPTTQRRNDLLFQRACGHNGLFPALGQGLRRVGMLRARLKCGHQRCVNTQEHARRRILHGLRLLFVLVVLVLGLEVMEVEGLHRFLPFIRRVRSPWGAACRQEERAAFLGAGEGLGGLDDEQARALPNEHARPCRRLIGDSWRWQGLLPTSVLFLDACELVVDGKSLGDVRLAEQRPLGRRAFSSAAVDDGPGSFQDEAHLPRPLAEHMLQAELIPAVKDLDELIPHIAQLMPHGQEAAAAQVLQRKGLHERPVLDVLELHAVVQRNANGIALAEMVKDHAPEGLDLGYLPLLDVLPLLRRERPLVELCPEGPSLLEQRTGVAAAIVEQRDAVLGHQDDCLI
eukprot:scaffold7673_cov258-Pinguiococcus_pyrenoidosus.AAC.3